MSENNAPEDVDLDEEFNHIDPELLTAVLVKNISFTIQSLCRQLSIQAMPLGLARMAGEEVTHEEYDKVILNIMQRVAIIKDLNELYSKITPINDEGMSQERIDVIKESVTRHPIIVEAAFRISESIEQKLARKFD